VDRARAAFGLNAVAVGVSADARLGWSGASGPPRDGVTPLSGATPFAIASVSKTFTAAIVLQLVEERRVELDAPVTRVAALDCPVAYAPVLEEVILPGSADVLKAIRSVAAY